MIPSVRSTQLPARAGCHCMCHLFAPGRGIQHAHPCCDGCMAEAVEAAMPPAKPINATWMLAHAHHDTPASAQHAGNGEGADPFYEGCFRGEQQSARDARLYWARRARAWLAAGRPEIPADVNGYAVGGPLLELDHLLAALATAIYEPCNDAHNADGDGCLPAVDTLAIDECKAVQRFVRGLLGMEVRHG